MNGARFRAWRFVHPDRRILEDIPSVGLQVGPQGRIQMVEDDEAVRQSLLILMSTAPGERVMRPTYGCELKRLVFAPNDDTTAGLAIHYVRRAVERWEPRAEIVSVDADADPETSGGLRIVLEYRVRSTGRTGRIVRPLDLAGESR
jgi:phage baseplate assembly protein W